MPALKIFNIQIMLIEKQDIYHLTHFISKANKSFPLI